MLSDNIRNHRKKINLSQDELAEKIGVSRQSVSFWETGQTQPTIDNIIALSKIFNISSDMLLDNCDSTNTAQDKPPENKEPKKKSKVGLIIAISTLTVVIIGGAILVVFLIDNPSKNDPSGSNIETGSTVTLDASAVSSSSIKVNSEITSETPKPAAPDSTSHNNNTPPAGGSKPVVEPNNGETTSQSTPIVPVETEFDLFSYCKDFAIKNGELNGDYCIYQQPATKYGGYDNEYFSISYWGDSNMVEFCLHCPLSETYSHNFYLRMRGGYNKKYEYLSSKYYRDNGESLRSAMGYIDPAVFSDSYPISCDKYEGSADGQNQFMEDTRVGICDLIYCLKNFVTTENMECDFSVFEFVNF